MVKLQKRCLNCNDFTPDDKDLNGNLLPPGIPAIAGKCMSDGNRKKDGWACFWWKPKRDTTPKGELT